MSPEARELQPGFGSRTMEVVCPLALIHSCASKPGSHQMLLCQGRALPCTDGVGGSPFSPLYSVLHCTPEFSLQKLSLILRPPPSCSRGEPPPWLWMLRTVLQVLLHKRAHFGRQLTLLSSPRTTLVCVASKWMKDEV